MNRARTSATSSIASGRQCVSVSRVPRSEPARGRKRLAWIEHERPVPPQIGDERVVRRVLQHTADTCVPRGEPFGMNGRLRRRGHHDERNPAGFEIAPEPRDGWTGIRLRRPVPFGGGRDAPAQRARVQERLPRDVTRHPAGYCGAIGHDVQRPRSIRTMDSAGRPLGTIAIRRLREPVCYARVTGRQRRSRYSATLVNGNVSAR